MVEIIGYIGMVFILVSFLMKNVIMLRFLNCFGGFLSMLYGISTNTIPTACLNGILVIINVTYLILYYIRKKKEKKDDQD